MWWSILAGLGLGLLKAQEDKKAAKAKAIAEATKTAWSPLTGSGMGETVTQPGMIGPLMQGGLTGAMIGQSWDSLAGKKGGK